MDSIRGVSARGLARLAGALLLGIAVPAVGHSAGYIGYSAGWFDFAQQDDESVELGVEYRSFEQLPVFDWLVLTPFAGLKVNTDGGLYGYSGVLWDIPLTDRITLTPSVAPGLYREGGSKDLGHVVEFYSRLELSYRLDNDSRIAVSVSHMSNLWLGDDNPGVESVSLRYIVPVN